MTQIIVPDAVLATAGRLLARRVGLRLDPAIRGRLARCVLDDAAAHALDVAAYVGRLDEEPLLLQSLLDRVTVQETSFFRDPNQFAGLRDVVLPSLSDPVSIWSAGCANGQEAYSLAMTLASTTNLVDWRVTASDISSRALERTRTAQYSARELKGVSAADLSRHFTPVGDSWQVASGLRQRVDVVAHNLVADSPPLPHDACNIVFCRNVLIYFRHEEVVAFLDRLVHFLRPGAWLFLGYSESLWQVTDAFELVRLGDAFAYRRRGAERLTAPAAQRTLPVDAGPPKRLRKRLPARSDGTGLAAATRRTRLRAEPEPAVPVAPVALGMVELSAAGEAAMQAADYVAAVTAFRKCAYLDPDQPVAHLHLGLALEAAGDSVSARRAYGAALRALRVSALSAVEAALEGYEPAELSSLLEAKLRIV